MASYLLAERRAHYGAEELEAELLGVEVEFLHEELGDFDGGEDRGEEEDHGVCAGGDDDAGVGKEAEGRYEFV